MEDRYHLGLGFRAQIDQQVTARDHVQPRERRVGQHVLHGEHHDGAQLRQHPIAAAFPAEEPRETLGGHLLGDCGRIEPLAGGGDGFGVDIGGEQLQPHHALAGFELFEQQNGQ